MQYKNPANRELVLEGLRMAGRMDLVGYGEKCLIRPLRESHNGSHTHGVSQTDHKKSQKKKTIRNTHNRKKQK